MYAIRANIKTKLKSLKTLLFLDMSCLKYSALLELVCFLLNIQIPVALY